MPRLTPAPATVTARAALRRVPFALAGALLLALSACGSSTDDTPQDAGTADATVADAGGCPKVTCADLDLSGAASATRYDPSTHVLTLVLGANPSVVSGSVSFMTAAGAMAPSTHSAPLVVNGTSATADLSTWLTSETTYFGALSLTFVGSCGATSVIGNLDVTTARGASGIEVTAFVCR